MTEVTQNQQYVAQLLAKHVVSKAGALTDEMRAIADARLLNDFNHPGENGRTKSIEVMHDGVHLGTFTVVEPQPSVVVKDEEALIEWLRETNPEAIKVKIVTEIDPGVLKQLKDTEHLSLSKDEGGPVARKKDGEVIPGLATKLAGEATQTRLAPFTGKGAAAKKDARDEVLDRLAENFSLEALAAQYDASKTIEANPVVAGEVVHHQGEDTAA